MSYTKTGPDTGALSIAREEFDLHRAFVRDYEEVMDSPQITSPDAAAELLGPKLFARDREYCFGVFLDTKHRVLEVAMISMGSVDHTFMAPREVFRDALLVNASAVIVGHNHPSGDPDPSVDDEKLAKRLSRAGEIVGVDLLDSLVFGGDRWISLARRGVI